jgi:hypothetical protein
MHYYLLKAADMYESGHQESKDYNPIITYLYKDLEQQD